MTTKDEYLAELTREVNACQAEIDKLEADAEKTTEEARQSHDERLSLLKRKRDAAREKLDEAETDESAWDTVKSAATSVWDDVTGTLKKSKDAFFEGLREESDDSDDSDDS